MESSGSSSVNDPQMEVHPVEDEADLAKTSKGLLRVHVRLIMGGVLTMEESKPVLSRAFFVLRQFGLDATGAWLSYDCDRLESLLARWEEVRLRRPSVEAAHQVSQERVEGDWGEDYSDDRWKAREAMFLDRLTRWRQATLSMIEGQMWSLIA